MRELKRLANGAEVRGGAAASAFADAAANAGLLDVAVGTVSSPIGELTVAVTPRGLARVPASAVQRCSRFERSDIIEPEILLVVLRRRD